MLGRKKKNEQIKLSKDAYKKARNFLFFLKPYRGIYLIGWLFLILSSVTAMLFPVLMGQLLGANSEDKPIIQSTRIDFTDINTILLVMFAVFALQAIFSFFRIYIFNNVTENALRDLRIKAFDKLVSLFKKSSKLPSISRGRYELMR